MAQRGNNLVIYVLIALAVSLSTYGQNNKLFDLSLSTDKTSKERVLNISFRNLSEELITYVGPFSFSERKLSSSIIRMQFFLGDGQMIGPPATSVEPVQVINTLEQLGAGDTISLSYPLLTFYELDNFLSKYEEVIVQAELSLKIPDEREIIIKSNPLLLKD